MGKLIFNAQAEPLAPVGESKHTMYVDSCDGVVKVKDSAGCVCSLDGNIISKQAMEQTAFGNGCDGDLHITVECTCICSGRYEMEAKEYNFNNLTIDDGIKVVFTGEGVPYIKVKNCFCNMGTIISYGPLIACCGCGASNVAGVSVHNTCNQYYSRAIAIKTLKGGCGICYGNWVSCCGGGIGENGGSFGGNAGGTGTEYGGGSGATCGGAGCSPVGYNGGNGGGGGGAGLCCGGNGGRGGGGDGCYGNGGNGGGYGSTTSQFKGGNSVYGNGGTGGVWCNYPADGGDSLYGTGGTGPYTSCRGGSGGWGRDGGAGSSSGCYSAGNGGSAFGGQYGLLIAAKNFYNNCLDGRGGNGGSTGSAYIGGQPTGGDASDGGCIAVVYNGCFTRGNITVKGGTKGTSTCGGCGCDGKDGTLIITRFTY